jgi:hypothetical protein
MASRGRYEARRKCNVCDQYSVTKSSRALPQWRMPGHDREQPAPRIRAC